ncbi:MAG: helix-turn-helix domain-containing protein [Blastomonas sp.]|uniref:helix-turn-helix domain-containing protein n=1 Tax=Blastomonas sp. TaxID=1909299 RepID=UPI0025889E6E|nr:helix-turn-helix domain-containing protein [Blastomonas sp.]MCO5792673.1 helix-turn-helix domain-containing protein [Blastomonas sp.]
MSVADTARYLSIGRTSTFALVRAGTLKSFTIGRKRLILVGSIEAFIADRCAAEHPEADNDSL